MNLHISGTQTCYYYWKLFTGKYNVSSYMWKVSPPPFKQREKEFRWVQTQ